MLLLLFVFNVPGVLVRQLVIFLRPVVHAGLRLVLSALVIDLWLEHSLVLVSHSALKGKLPCRLNRALSIVEEVQELLVDGQHLVVVEAVWLPVDQALDRGQLLKNQNVLVVLVQVNVRQVRVQQVLIQWAVDVGRLLQIHDRAQNLEKVLRDLIRLLRHDGTLRVAQEEIVPLLPEHDSESRPLVVHYLLVDEAHVLQDVLDVQATSLVNVVLNHVLVLSVQLHRQKVV